MNGHRVTEAMLTQTVIAANDCVVLMLVVTRLSQDRRMCTLVMSYARFKGFRLTAAV